MYSNFLNLIYDVRPFFSGHSLAKTTFWGWPQVVINLPSEPSRFRFPYLPSLAGRCMDAFHWTLRRSVPFWQANFEFFKWNLRKFQGHWIAKAGIDDSRPCCQESTICEKPSNFHQSTKLFYYSKQCERWTSNPYTSSKHVFDGKSI